MLNRILVGLDGSALAELSLPYVAALAGASHAEVTLVRVVSEGDTLEPLEEVNPRLLPYMAVMPGTPREESQAEPRANVHAAQAYLDAVADRLRQQGIVVEPVVTAGEAADALIEEAQLHHADLIVLSTHGRSGLGRWIYGSVAESVLQRTPVPVFLARAWPQSRPGSPRPALSSILVPLDGSALAEQALPTAAELARAMSAQLHLVRVVPLVFAGGMDELAAYGAITSVDVEAEQRDAKLYLDAVVGRLHGEGVQAVPLVSAGQPITSIVSLAETCQAGLIVMATHGRSGLARTVAGSIALGVLHRGHLPVLLVRPAAVTQAAR